MNLKEIFSIVAAPGLLALAVTAGADPADPAQPQAPASDTAKSGYVDEIIVTARRVAERLTDVPQTVTAVSGDELSEYRILKFEDISQLVPGLDLQSDNSGFRATASVRGVSFDPSSQGTPTVEVYFNEVPVDPSLIFQGNFDIGQIEVLRGPQGTLRGRSAPSGSITQGTRRADLVEMGSSVNATFTDLDGINIQGAIGLPLIEDKLGVRLATIYDFNDAGGVKSGSNAKDPHAKTQGARLSLLFKPTDSLTGFLMYQRLERTTDAYGPIQFGPGATGMTSAATATLPAVVAPANFNGGQLTGNERTSIVEFPRHVEQEFDIVTLQTDWAVAGQQLSYIGGYSRVNLDAAGDSDGTNTIIGSIGPVEATKSIAPRVTHELRLSSEERIAGLFDYTVGGYYGRLSSDTLLMRPDTQILAGAFGSPLGTAAPGGPGTLSPFTYDTRYANDLMSRSVSVNVEKSIFANVILHLGDKTEVSLGGRKIFSEITKSVDARSIAGIQAVQNPNGLGACPVTVGGRPVVGTTYPGTCDVTPIPPVFLRSVPKTTREDEPFVYSSSLSYHFTPDLVGYATYGTSWRAGPGPITGAPLCSATTTPGAPDPTLCDKYNTLDPEDAKGLEIGFKAALFDQRLSISVAAYEQTYDGYITFGQPTPYLTGPCAAPINPAACRVATGAFTYNADVETRGVDLDVTYRFNQDLSVGTAFSYSRGRFQDSPIPCRDQLDANGAPGFDGVPDSGAMLTTAQWLALGGPLGPTLCQVSTSSSTSPPWNANLRGEYSIEMFQGNRGFVRGLFNYYAKNTNRQVSNTSFIPESYQLLSLYLGLRSDDGSWEVSLSGNNILDDDTVLNQTLNDGTLLVPQQGRSFGTNSGYRTISMAPRREFSLSMRYAFGSN